MLSGTNKIATYRDSFIIAGDFSSSTEVMGLPVALPVPQLTAVYNTIPLHSRPLALNTITNSLLRHLQANLSTQFSIGVSTHPLPQPKTSQFESVATGGSSFLTFGYGIPIPLGLAILVSSFLIFPLSERATNAKQVQLMTGLHPAVFWMSNLVWDFLLYSLSAFIMFGLILGLDEKETFLSHDAWGAQALVILLLGWFGIPFSYAFSFLANNAAAGFAFLIIVNILAGCIAPTAVFMLRDFGTQFDSDVLIDAADIVQWIFYWFPIFPFTRALMAIITVGITLSYVPIFIIHFLCFSGSGGKQFM